MRDIEIAFGVSDNYMHCLRPACFLFNKFWSPNKKVKIFGYSKPQPTLELPDNFEFISLGIQRGPTYSAQDRAKICDYIEGSHFIFVVENDFLIRPVNFDILDALGDILDDSVARIDLTPSSSGHSMGDVIWRHSNFDIFELPQSAPWRMALGHYSVWKKDYLKKYLDDLSGTTPWEFESKGCAKAKNDGARMLATNREYATYFIDSAHAHRENNSLDLTGIAGRSSFGLSVPDEVIEEMISKKIVKRNGSFYSVI